MHVSVVKRVHPIADTHFHLGSWLLNSRKWASQFWWYDAILIKPVKSVDQPWLNPMVWRLNLIIFNIKLFYLRWLFHESGLLSYHICHILTSTYHITHFHQFDLRWSYDLAYGFPSESSQYPNKKVPRSTCNITIFQILHHFREIFKRFYNFLSRWTQDGCYSIAYQLEVSH